jgi:hypothetical protein
MRVKVPGGGGRGDVESVLLAADAALYRAKAEGRNRMMVADAPSGQAGLATCQIPPTPSPLVSPGAVSAV